MFKTSLLIRAFFMSVLLINLSSVCRGDIIVIPDSPYSGTPMPMTPVNQLSGDHLVWTDMMDGVKLFNGAATIPLSRDTMAIASISGTNVAWRGMSGRIYFWDGQYIRLVPRLYATISASGQFAFDGSTIAWIDGDLMGMNQLFLWDGTVTVQLSTGQGLDPMYQPQISGSNAVWKQYDPVSGFEQLFFWNGTERLEIASGMFDPMCTPRISGANVAWVQSDDQACPQVFFWNGTTVTQITEYTPEIWTGINGLKLSGSHVAWLTTYGVCSWNGGEIVQLAGNPYEPFNCLYFDVSGTYVAWHEWKDYDRIYFYDGVDTVEITEAGTQIMPPPMPDSGTFMMSGQNIAWIAQTMSTPAMAYFWNGQVTGPLSTPDMSGAGTLTLLGVSGKNVAWYADGAIFLSRQVPESCQEALALGYSIASDLNRDCKVNLSDVAIFSSDWLRTFDPEDSSHETPWAD